MAAGLAHTKRLLNFRRHLLCRPRSTVLRKWHRGHLLLLAGTMVLCVVHWHSKLALRQPSFVSGPMAATYGKAPRSSVAATTAEALEVATDREQPGLGADVVAELERLAETKSISSDEFWALVARGDVMEAMAISWSEKQLLVRKKDSTFVAVKDGFNV